MSLETELFAASERLRKIADAAPPMPLRIEVSRERFRQIRAAIDHETEIDVSSILPGNNAPVGAVDVQVLPEAPPGFWRVVWRCKACHGEAKATATCRECFGKGEVYQP